jgi:hypothetical protein
MRKTIIAIVAFAVFTVSNSFAQAYKSNGHDGPVYVTSSRINTSITDMDLRELDRVVSLSKSQEKKISRIKAYYASVIRSSKKSRSQASINRLDEQERRDITSVLTASQLKRLNAYQYAAKENSRSRTNMRNRPNSRG